MEEHPYYERIQQYVDGELSAADRLAFEQALSDNEALREEYEMYRAAEEVVDHLEYEQLRTTIGTFEKKDHRSTSLRLRPWVMAAAAVLLLIIAWGWYQSGNHTDQQLALQYYEAPNISELRGQDNSANLLKEATTAYLAKDFDQAITLLQQEMQKGKDRPSILFLLAHSYTQKGEGQLAIDAFQQLLETRDARYEEHAEWHLALSYLKNGQAAKCQELLTNIIANPYHGFRTDAIELDRQLQSFFRKIAF